MFNFTAPDASSPLQNTPAPPTQEACRKCGLLGIHVLKPASPPHAFSMHCEACGSFIKWHSVRSKEERAAQRGFHRDTAMRERPPTIPQLAYLSALGFSGSVSSMLSASLTIAGLLEGRRA